MTQDRFQSLTPREHEVLVRLARGASNAGIARDLVVSPKTVDRHIARLYAKLGLPADEPGVHRRVAVAVAYWRLQRAAAA